MSYIATQYDVSNYHGHEIDFCSIPLKLYRDLYKDTWHASTEHTDRYVRTLHVLFLRKLARIISCYRSNKHHTVKRPRQWLFHNKAQDLELQVLKDHMQLARAEQDWSYSI